MVWMDEWCQHGYSLVTWDLVTPNTIILWFNIGDKLTTSCLLYVRKPGIVCNLFEKLLNNKIIKHFYKNG